MSRRPGCGQEQLTVNLIRAYVEGFRGDPVREPFAGQRSFSELATVRGDGDVVVTGAAGLQALTLAYRVADAISASPLAAAGP